MIINSKILKRGITEVLHCIDPTEIRTAMSGVNMTITGDKIVFVGTNGVKLAEFEMDINADIVEKSYTLKYNFASILRSILDDDAQVFMRFEGDKVYVQSDDMAIVGALIIDGRYPDYKPMFNLRDVVRVPRIDFSDTVHGVMDVLDPEDNHRLTVNFNDSTLLLKNDMVESTQTFDESFGANLDVDINGEFLDSILHDFVDEYIEIHFTPGNNYVVLKSPDNKKHTALITVVKRR